MINSFDKQYAFLSNFFSSPVQYEGLIFPSVEHAFHAAKTFDPLKRQKFTQNILPGEAKRMGRKLELRSDWEEVKVGIMKQLLLSKFTDSPELRSKLLQTKSKMLIEGNFWHDNFWGDCYCPKCADKKGQNHLGQLLMEVRDELAQKE